MIAKILLDIKPVRKPRKLILHSLDNDKYAEIFSRFPDNWNSMIWFSQMCLNVRKFFYTKQKPRIIQYWICKKFSNEASINDL